MKIVIIIIIIIPYFQKVTQSDVNNSVNLKTCPSNECTLPLHIAVNCLLLNYI